MPPGRTKERLEGNLKKAVESFIEWLILGLLSAAPKESKNTAV
jgi:hypothetical protein